MFNMLCKHKLTVSSHDDVNTFQFQQATTFTDIIIPATINHNTVYTITKNYKLSV